MPRLNVNDHAVDVDPGCTILHAARQIGVPIPTLCHRDGLQHNAACMVCVVAVEGERRFLPACATPVAEGMRVRTEGADLDRARRMAVELLLGDHVGDCEAPCRRACPAGLDIPTYLRLIQDGEEHAASAMASQQLVVPRSLGHLCPAPCEKACRRTPHDAPVGIRALHRFIPISQTPPPTPPPSGKSVAVVGGGPTGLAAARALFDQGHSVTILDASDTLGGRLCDAVVGRRLPSDAVAADIDDVLACGIRVACRAQVDQSRLDTLCRDHDAVLLTTGARGGRVFALEQTGHGYRVDPLTMQTSQTGLFAAGGAVRGNDRSFAQAVGDGHHAADAIHRQLAGESPPPKRVHVQMGSLTDAERATILRHANPESTLQTTAGDLAEEYRVREAARCLHCECRARDACRLRDVAGSLGASPHAFRQNRRPYEVDDTHPTILFEPGKCIACGLCIQVARRVGESRGHTWIGRGFSVRVGAPLDGNVGEALREAGVLCVDACPTGALALRDRSPIIDNREST